MGYVLFPDQLPPKSVENPSSLSTGNNAGGIGCKLDSVGDVGKKYDSGKPEYALLPPFALDEVVKVLTIGAMKYHRNNWRLVPDAPRRYFNAAQRHMWAIARGENVDEESGLHHAAHAISCLLFLMEHDLGHAISTTSIDSTSQKKLNTTIQ